MNKVHLAGNLGNRPETNSGGVCRFSIATKSRKKDAGPDWHRIVTFGKQAEICQQYLDKGRRVIVVGRLETRTYEQEGQKKYTTEVIADEIEFFDSPQRQETPVEEIGF
jgi:single-strand DNA-binding protein